MSRRVIITIGVILMLLTAFTLCLLSGMFTPAAPSGWDQVHAGMSRSEVLTLVGTPQQSGWPENIAETWERRGLVSHRRLFIIYEGERVHDLYDGMWVRGFGWSHPRRESL